MAMCFRYKSSSCLSVLVFAVDSPGFVSEVQIEWLSVLGWFNRCRFPWFCVTAVLGRWSPYIFLALCYR